MDDHLGRVLIALLLSFFLAFVAALPHAHAAPAVYYCGNAGSGHCYAKVYWTGATAGAYSAIDVVDLNCNPLDCYNWSQGGELGFIDNEMWFSQDNSYWVEAGYTTYSTSITSTINDYYWADYRPNLGYSEHYLSTVPSGDYGYAVDIQINKDPSFSNEFDVNLWSNTWSSLNLSTNNTMAANKIWEGQELAGTEGAEAPAAYITDAEWQSVNNGTWHYQTTSGTNGDNNVNVDEGYWYIVPNGSNHGGEWEDYCCQGY